MIFTTSKGGNAAMSQEEQDAILGRLIRERNSLSSQLALVDAELQAFSDTLHLLKGATNSRVHRRHQLDLSNIKQIPDTITKYADLTNLKALFTEQDELIDKYERCVQSLKDLGV
jgi:hypothetical protein